MSKGERSREAIVQRALELASLGGVENLTIGRLAKDVEMSKSGLFAHFKSKEQLQLEVLKTAAEKMVQQVIAPAVKEPRGEPRLRALFEKWLAWDRDGLPGGCPFQAASSEDHSQSSLIRQYVSESQQDLLKTLETIAQAGIEAGKLQPALNARLFAFELLGLIAAFHRFRYILKAPDAEALAWKSFEALLARAVLAPA